MTRSTHLLPLRWLVLNVSVRIFNITLCVLHSGSNLIVTSTTFASWCSWAMSLYSLFLFIFLRLKRFPVRCRTVVSWCMLNYCYQIVDSQTRDKLSIPSSLPLLPNLHNSSFRLPRGITLALGWDVRIGLCRTAKLNSTHWVKFCKGRLGCPGTYGLGGSSLGMDSPGMDCAGIDGPGMNWSPTGTTISVSDTV